MLKHDKGFHGVPANPKSIILEEDKMQPRDFCYWLKGYFELRKDQGEDKHYLDEVQTQIIEDHLDLVFKKETPDRQPRKEDVVQLRSILAQNGVPNKNDDIYCTSSFTMPPDQVARQDQLKHDNFPTIFWPDGPPASC
jgi:hypothetical protein